MGAVFQRLGGGEALCGAWAMGSLELQVRVQGRAPWPVQAPDWRALFQSGSQLSLGLSHLCLYLSLLGRGGI